MPKRSRIPPTREIGPRPRGSAAARVINSPSKTRGAEPHCDDLDENVRSPAHHVSRTSARQPRSLRSTDGPDRSPAGNPRADSAAECRASWRITSFSTLTKEKHAHGAPTLAESSLEPPAVSTIVAPVALPSLFAGARPARPWAPPFTIGSKPGICRRWTAMRWRGTSRTHVCPRHAKTRRHGRNPSVNCFPICA